MYANTFPGEVEMGQEFIRKQKNEEEQFQNNLDYLTYILT